MGILDKIDAWEGEVLGAPNEPEPGRLGWGAKHKRQARRWGLPDPTYRYARLNRVMKNPMSKWHRDRWKRRRARWDRKLLGIRPSHIALTGLAVYPWMDTLGGRIEPRVVDAALIAGIPIATYAWKVAADKVNERKRKRLARMKRRLKRARREEMGDSTPPIRERMAEPPYYTDSPVIVRDNPFNRRNRNQL